MVAERVDREGCPRVRGARCEQAAAGLSARTGRTVQGRRFLDAEVPAGRWALPGELAGAALLLTDPQSAYLTGVVLPVDGGLGMGI